MVFNSLPPNLFRLGIIYCFHFADAMSRAGDLTLTGDRSEDLKAGRTMPKATSLTTVLHCPELTYTPKRVIIHPTCIRISTSTTIHVQTEYSFSSSPLAGQSPHFKTHCRGKRKLNCSTCTKGNACMLFETLSSSYPHTCHLSISPIPHFYCHCLNAALICLLEY